MKKKLILTIALILVAIGVIAFISTRNSEDSISTTIITNARVETITTDSEEAATAVVLKEGGIEYVGNDKGAMEYDDARQESSMPKAIL